MGRFPAAVVVLVLLCGRLDVATSGVFDSMDDEMLYPVDRCTLKT